MDAHRPQALIRHPRRTVMKHVRRAFGKRRWIVVGLVSVVAASVWAPPVLAAAKKKFYSTTIAAPATSFGGDTEHFTVTITNLPSSQQTLGSANVIVPSGFTSLTVVAVTPPV